MWRTRFQFSFPNPIWLYVSLTTCMLLGRPVPERTLGLLPLNLLYFSSLTESSFFTPRKLIVGSWYYINLSSIDLLLDSSLVSSCFSFSILLWLNLCGWFYASWAGAKLPMNSWAVLNELRDSESVTLTWLNWAWIYFASSACMLALFWSDDWTIIFLSNCWVCSWIWFKFWRMSRAAWSCYWIY